MRVKQLLLLLFVVALRNAASEFVAVKCCGEGKQLHRARNECVPVQSSDSKSVATRSKATRELSDGARTDAGNVSSEQSIRGGDIEGSDIVRFFQEHFDLNLTEQADATSEFINAPTTNETDADRKTIDDISEEVNSTDVSAFEENFPFDVSWLPDVLKDKVTKESEIAFGRQNNCSDLFTVRLETPRDNHRMQWLTNGSLILHSYTVHGGYEELVLQPHEFCTDTIADDDNNNNNNNNTQKALLLCVCDRVKCIRKCCPLGQSYIKSNNVAKGYKFQCGSYNRSWTPFDLEVRENNISFETVAGEVECEEDYQPNIQLMYPGVPAHIIQSTWIDTAKDNSVCEETVVVLDTYREVKGVVRCFLKNPLSKVQFYTKWFHVLELVFWAMVILATELVPRKRVSPHSQVHDYALVWHALCLLLRSVMYLVRNLSDRYCEYSSMVVYFLATAASLWLTVLSINMACGFWKPMGSRKDQRKRWNPMMYWYSLFAWGVSGAMTIFTAVMWYCRDVPAGLLRPTLHDTGTCFLETDPSQKMATFAYFYGPIGFLMLVSVGLFLSITVRVRQMRRNTSILRRQKQAEEKERAKSEAQEKQKPKGQSSFGNDKNALMYIKLLLLMGVMEMGVEIVTWLLNTNPGYFGFFAMWIDVLRAASMFALCCCNRRAVTGLRDRLYACALMGAFRDWTAKRKEAHLQGVQGQYSASKE